MNKNMAEKETIGLCIALEALDEIANHSMLTMRDVQQFPGEAELIFESGVHRDLFLVRLLDFVKEGGAKSLTGVEGSCLAVLKNAALHPSFDKENSVSELERSISTLEDWLNAKSTVNLWLPTLDVQAKLTISRLDLITISGNHSKHNLSRLTGVCRLVAASLREHGHDVDEEMLPLALDNFREHLSDNYFVYYSTWLAELLNNIRWGLQTYLLPTFAASYEPDANGIYRYAYPEQIVNRISQKWFWRLMNNVMRQPNVKRFRGAFYLKNKSSLERMD